MREPRRKALWRRFLQFGTAPREATRWRRIDSDALETQIPLTAQNIESRHGSNIAGKFDRSRSSTSIESSVLSRTLGRLVGPRFVGWRLAVLHFGVWVSIAFVFNLTATIWGSMATREEKGVLFEGECVFTRRLNTGLHVLINVLSAILLAGSNYTMQCMSSPTRQEIDRSHALSPPLPLQIGVPGIRNLTKIGRHRAILWCILGASSLPLHLFYNSAIFSSISSNSYWAISTSESFVTDTSCLNCPKTTGEFSSVLNRLWNNASAGMLERLDPAECRARYATSIQSAQRNVLLVASDNQVLPPNENTFINGSHVYGRSKFRATSAMARDTARDSFDWVCSGIDTKRPCSLEIEVLRDPSAESWLMGPGAGGPVEYCLSERADPTCKLHFEPTIGIIVTILNFVKAGVMFYVAFFVGEEPLMTMGEAVASFLEQPDPTSKNRCLWTFADTTKPFRDSKGIKHRRALPKRWTCPQYRWRDATSSKRRVVTVFMFLVALSVVTILLGYGINALPPGTTLSQLEFVGLDPRSTIDMRNFPDSLMLKVVIANSPQVAFSLLYFSYNALLTAMLMGYEWVSYAHKRKGLRVSHQPTGAQRCTYFLQLPYRFSIPLLLLSAVLHWLVSQSLFLMSIDFYDSLGRPGNDLYNSKFFGYQTVGFSPPAIITVLVLGGLMTISILALGRIPYKRGMPVAGSSSIAISAACHITAEDGADEGTVSIQKLQWGVVSRADNGPGHCAFSPKLVETPVKGRVYI